MLNATCGIADINQRLAEHSEHHTGGRAFLHDSLRLLTDAHRAYQHSGDADRRLANQAFYTRLDITDNEQLHPRLAEPFATIFREAHAGGDEGKEAKREHTTSFNVACSRKALWVDAARIKRSDAERMERLSSLWDQVRSGVAGDAVIVEEDGSGVVRNPKRRARTPLTVAEVEAIRAARVGGEGATSIAERFSVSRVTVWEKTRAK